MGGILKRLILHHLHSFTSLTLLMAVLADHIQLTNPVLETEAKHIFRITLHLLEAILYMWEHSLFPFLLPILHSHYLARNCNKSYFITWMNKWEKNKINGIKYNDPVLWLVNICRISEHHDPGAEKKTKNMVHISSQTAQLV